MRKIIALIVFFCLAIPANASNKLSTKDLIRLDSELRKASDYDVIKYKRLKDYKDKLHDSYNNPRVYNKLLLDIGKEYETFQSDSAMTYYNKAITFAWQQNDSTQIIAARLCRVKVLGILGFFKEASDELELLEKNEIPEVLKGDWLDSGRQLYSYMLAYVKDNDIYANQYRIKLNHYRDEQIKVLEPNSPMLKLFLAEHYIDNGEPNIAHQILSQLIEEIPDSTNVYARATNILSQLRTNVNDDDGAAYYLVLSAISDIKSSVKENMSLQELALYLYTSGDFEHAYTYLSSSLSDAVFCNARLRTMEVSKIMPLIDKAYKIQLYQKRQNLLVAIIFVTILSICLVITIILVLKQMRKLRTTRQHLKEANNVKDEYIGRFLDLCSIYMDRLDSFYKIVVRKIAAGQVEELVQMTRSNKFSEEQHKQFYKNFDSAFLHIYPSFIDQLNQLLRPEEQIVLKEPGELTTELRILAFMRMGVDDSNKVATFLHYSVNTIYTYRNKIKSKAIDRENFEENLMKIDTSV